MSGVQSLERAFGILRALSLGPAGVTDLSERTGIPKSTVSRLLSSLETERAVSQTAEGSYELGGGIGELADALTGSTTVVDLARPHMVELMELTGEAVGLSRLEGKVVRYLAQVDDPDSTVVVRDWTSETAPVHAVPSGLAMLANAGRSVQRNILDGDLEKCTDITITDRGLLLLRLEQIRTDGYAWCFQEFTDDINSVGAAINDGAGRPSLALHVHGPAYRFPDDIDIHELGQRVVATAHRIEAQLLGR